MANINDIPKLKTRARIIFAHLVQGMEPGSSKTLDNSKGTFMPLHVERLSDDTFSLTHYHHHHSGDLLKDPDMEFFRTPDGDFIPLYFQNDMAMGGVFRQAVEVGGPERFKVDVRECREQCQFAAMWLENIVSQQGLRI